MKKILGITIMFMLILSYAAFAESFSGKVISVIDGNNLIVAQDTKLYRIRLVGIEAPEIDQPFGNQAKQFVTDLVRGQEVWVDVKGKDHDNRLLSIIIVDGKDLSLELINAGLAWSCTKFLAFPKILSGEKLARENRIGMWAYSGNKRPEVYRLEKRGIIAVMSKSPTYIGKSDFSFISKNFGWGIKDASWPPAGNRAPTYGFGIGTSTTGTVFPAATPPYSAHPGSIRPPGSYSPPGKLYF